jgi:hypothetical protein
MVLSGTLDAAARLAVAVLVADRVALPNGEEGALTYDNGGGGGGSGKDDGDNDDDNHAGASVVGSIRGVDHGRAEIMNNFLMNNFLHVWLLVVSLPHIVASDGVFSMCDEIDSRSPSSARLFYPPL